MNYAQMSSLFRVEERPVGFAIASVANVLITIGATIALVVGAREGRDRRRDRQLHRHARRLRRRCSPTAATSSGSQFDRPLLRAMNRFGLPLVPGGARALGGQLHRPPLHRALRRPGRGRHLLAGGADLVGDHLPDDRVPARLARVRLLDPRRRRRAKRTYSYVLTYLLLLTCWMSLALAVLAPWLVDLLAPDGDFARSARRGAAPLLRDGRLLRLQRARDRDRTGAADAVQLDRHRRSRPP